MTHTVPETATTVQGLAGPVVNAVVGLNVYARLQAEALQVWGGGGVFGTMGLGTVLQPVYAPTTVATLGYDVSVLATPSSSYLACIVTTNGGIKCWGDQTEGGLGNGKTSGIQPSPIDVIGLSAKAVAVSAGVHFGCALLVDGRVQCWGINWEGEAGDGSGNDSLVPNTVSGIVDAIAITSGASHTCVLSKTGGVKCWGADDFG